jgi:hypothetical protein
MNKLHKIKITGIFLWIFVVDIPTSNFIPYALNASGRNSKIDKTIEIMFCIWALTSSILTPQDKTCC